MPSPVGKGGQVECWSRGAEHGSGQRRRDFSPSPRPSPLGRGRIVHRACANPQRLDLSRRGMRCSLSLRERGRVRGERSGTNQNGRTNFASSTRPAFGAALGAGIQTLFASPTGLSASAVPPVRPLRGHGTPSRGFAPTAIHIRPRWGRTAAVVAWARAHASRT